VAQKLAPFLVGLNFTKY